jgi:uncharacterized protein with HEPN domain
MSRDQKLYLEDIFNFRYTSGKSFEVFKSDDLLYDGVIRNLEIIGEAAKNVTENIRNQDPAIEWRAISALRNIVAHEYFGIKDEIIWDIIQNKLPVLRSQIERLIKANPD